MKSQSAEITVPGISGITFDDSIPSVTINSDFTIHGLTVSPQSLTLSYSSDVFKLFGSAVVQLGTDFITVSFGDEANPGLLVTSGTFDQVSMGLTANFALKSLGFAPNGLSFEWDNGNNVFEIYGGATVSFDSESMMVSLGDAISPGIEISNGDLTKINLGLSADFNLKGLSFKPEGLTFQWDSSSDEFQMFGNVLTSFDSETIEANLGNAGAPGLTILSGVVQKVNIGFRTEFMIKDLSFKQENLSFHWDKSTDQFEIFGDSEVTFDGESILISMGSDADPGIRIVGGIVDHINLGVSANFNMKSIDFQANGLTFHWDKSADQFEIFGETSTSFDGQNMAISLGNDADPGLIIRSGVVEQINMGITADFNMKSMAFKAEGLTFNWNKASDHYEIYGLSTVTFDSETIEVSLGTDSDPGIKIDNGLVDHINMTVTANFTLKAMSFKADGLTFVWNKAGDYFQIYGVTEASFDGATLSVTMGDSSDPGIKIDNNVLEHINMKISTDFDMKGMSFDVQDLSFDWDKDSNNFLIFGSATTTFEGETLSVLLGDPSDPGILIVNNVVQHINMGITADFKLKTMEFEAEGLTYHWDKTANQFEIFGSTTAKFDGEEVSISLGSDSDPGIAVQNDVIQHINMGVTADISLKAMTIKPQDLTFRYDRSSNHFEMFGSADLTVEGHDAGISMGDDDDPGLVFKNNVLEQINMAITEDFTLKGLTIKTNNLGVDWIKGTKHFDFYGDMELDLANETINADMGTSSDPGMQFRNGKLHSMDITVNSDFKIGNLEVTTRDVEVKYTDSKFFMTGEIEVDEVWSVKVDLGEDGSNGLEIDASHHPDKLKLTDFKIEVDHVDLGAIDFKKVEISFQNDVIHEAELDVSIPPGYEVDATMTFAGSPAKLNSIDISFDATNFDTAIPIGDTGIDLVHLEGGMFNLANPNQTVQLTKTVHLFGQDFIFPGEKVKGVYFQGSVAFVFGGPASIAGHSAALLYQNNTATISGTGVELGASLLVGAYRSGSHWRSILGDGSINMDLVWGRSYSVNAHMNIPSDPLVEFSAGAKLSASGSFDALVDVKLKVPKSVPIVGGKTLGSVDGGIHYNRHHLSSSYAAGWASYWFFGTHHFGARYKFSNRKVDVIGSGTVSSIKRQISSALSENAGSANMGIANEASEWVKDVRTFEIPPYKSSMLVEIDMGKVVDEAYVSVIGPEGFYDVYEIKKTEVAEDEPPLMELEDRITKFELDSAANLLVINHEPEDDSLQHQFSTLAPGNYDLLVSYRGSNNVDSVGVNVSYFSPNPFGEISSVKLSNGQIKVDMDYWAQFPDSTQLSVYWNDTASHSGYHIATLDYGQADELGFGETELTFNPFESVDQDSLYFYFTIQDSSGVPVYSEFSDPIKHESPVVGTVNVTGATEEADVKGIMVFVDENGDGFYDTAGTNNDFEPSTLTDGDGKFHLNNMTVGQTYTIDIVVPFGYSLANGETGKRTFVFNGQVQNFTFNLELD